MINPFLSITKFSDDENFEEYLTKIHLMAIFKPLLDEFDDKELFKKIVRFIVYGYSLESDYLMTHGKSWVNVSKFIYEECDLPDEGELFEAVADLQSEAVRTSIENWLRLINDEAFTNYIHFRDLRAQFLKLSISNMKKATGEIDIEAKMKAAIYSKDLLKMMEEARETLVQHHPKLKVSTDHLNKVNKDKSGRSAANYAI